MALNLARRALVNLPKYQASRPLSLVSNASGRECLLNVPETEVTKIKNGMRVASENSGLPTCTVGVWVDAGSRYETEENNGVAHFFEHMCFKGTQKRTQHDLELEVENMGAHLNAYTSREHTVYYAKCLTKDVERAVEILSDILLNSKLGETEIEREKPVILREMEEIEQNQQEVVFDHLHAAAFQGTPLARTILGPSDNVKNMNRTQLTEYLRAHYTAPRMALCAAGGVEHGQMVDLAEKYFGTHSANLPSEIPNAGYGCRYTGSEIHYRDDSMPYLYGALAVEGVGWDHPDSIPLQIGNLLMGNWDRTQGCGVNSATRMVQQIGFGPEVQSYQSFSTCYKDTGLWGVYFVMDGGDGPTIDRFMAMVQTEWKHLCTSVTDEEVLRGKNLLKTQLLLGLDGTTPIAEDIGRQVLVYGRRVPLHEMEQRINAVDADVVREVMSKHLYDREPVVSAIGRTEGMEDYNILRQRMSWWRM
jgi:processing peptidase subunit beta